MGVEGIGASVVRKEDRRFITGKGRYVDDIKLLGMTHAHFVRSPHAHAKVKSIDSSEAMKMPGVVGVLTGQQIVDDKIGNLICGWAITSKDGTGDEDGRMAGDGAGNRAFRRPGGRGRDRRDQEPGHATRPRPWSSITRNCRPPPTFAPRSSRARRNCTRKPRAT